MSIACDGISLQFLNKFSIGIQKKEKKPVEIRNDIANGIYYNNSNIFAESAKFFFANMLDWCIVWVE